jgi:hypothetical protein
MGAVHEATGGNVGLVRFASAERCFHDEHAPTGDDQGKLANVAELADAQDLGSCGATRPGSSPGVRT